MALVRGPLLSVHATGSLGKKITFRKHRSPDAVLEYTVPERCDMTEQSSAPYLFESAALYWQRYNDRSLYNHSPEGAMQTSWGAASVQYGRIWGGYQFFVARFAELSSAYPEFPLLRDYADNPDATLTLYFTDQHSLPIPDGTLIRVWIKEDAPGAIWLSEEYPTEDGQIELGPFPGPPPTNYGISTSYNGHLNGGIFRIGVP